MTARDRAKAATPALARASSSPVTVLRAAEQTAQLSLGRCNVVPLPALATRPFRTELTVEQASLFVSNEYEGEAFVRESVVKHPDTEETVILRMAVGRSHPGGRARGVLRQSHQDVFYKVLQAWGEQGYPVGTMNGKVYGAVRITAYGLVRSVFPTSDNGRSYRRVRELLRDLQAIPIVLENVYTWQGLRDREEFTLLSEVTWSERKVDKRGIPAPDGGESTVTILLSTLVTEGFLNRHIKVLLAEPYDSLDSGKRRGRRSEIARLLYPFLDDALTKKETFDAPLAALAERFGLRRYDYPSKRKEKFEAALRALDGKPICEGKHVLEVSLRTGRDDYIFHAVRKPCPAST